MRRTAFVVVVLAGLSAAVAQTPAPAEKPQDRMPSISDRARNLSRQEGFLSYVWDERRGQLRLVASPDGARGSLTIRQDARLYLSLLNDRESVNHELQTGRHAWLQVLRGRVSVNGTLLETSDGLAISDERHLTVVGEQAAEVMLFDLA